MCGGGLWQRWTAYATNGHGGNKELKMLLQSQRDDYASTFQYSVLEVGGLNASDEHVASGEAHWKKVLCSRKFGYNQN